MNRKLLDLSGKINDIPIIIDVCESISSVAGSLGIPFFVVGATARDLIFERGYNVKSIRATEDIDFGVHVADWDQYYGLKEGLLATGNYSETRQKYKGILKVDMVPFGPFKDENHEIIWAPDNDFKMNILGFEEALEHSLPVKLKADSGKPIPFASPAGLALLKIIAWDDRTPDLRGRDAKDLSYIMKNYLEADNSERLYNEEHPIIEEDSDYEQAGARLLGRDIARMVKSDTKAAILSILESQTGEQKAYPLVEEMMDSRIARGDDFEENLKLLEILKHGIEDI